MMNNLYPIYGFLISFGPPGATAYFITRIIFSQNPPVLEEMGHCDSVYLSEVGDTQVVVFKHGE